MAQTARQKKSEAPPRSSPTCSTAALDAELVEVVFQFIDRMNDAVEEVDPAHRILEEFLAIANPIIDRIIESR